jgi:hypothetical protein
MKRCLRMLIAAAVLTLIVAANAFAAGNPQGNPNALLEGGAQPVGGAACAPGHGETSGEKKPDTGTRPFGAVHKAGEVSIGGPSCSVPLPNGALFIVD